MTYTKWVTVTREKYSFLQNFQGKSFWQICFSPYLKKRFILTLFPHKIDILKWLCKLKSFQTGSRDCFSFSPNISHFKQAVVTVFHSHQLLVLVPTFYPLQFSKKVWLPVFVYKLCHFINKYFSIDSFLDWEGHRWVFAHFFQTTAKLSLYYTATIFQKAEMTLYFL